MVREFGKKNRGDLWLSGKESAWKCRRGKTGRFEPWVGKIPWRRSWILAWSFERPEERGGLQRGH